MINLTSVPRPHALLRLITPPRLRSLASRARAWRTELLAGLLSWACAAQTAAQTFSGTLDPSHPSDTILVTTPSDGSVTFTIVTGPLLNLNRNADLATTEGIVFYDTDGTTRFFGASQGEGTTASYTVNWLRPGNYRIQLTRLGDPAYPTLGYGPYTMTVTSTPDPLPVDPEPNDDFAHALTASLDQPVTGHLGFRGQGQGPEQQDFWSVTLPSDGELQLSLGVSENLNINRNASLGLDQGINLYDADRQTRLYANSLGQGMSNTFAVPKLKAGTYYLRLARLDDPGYPGLGFGSYTLTPHHVPAVVMAQETPSAWRAPGAVPQRGPGAAASLLPPGEFTSEAVAAMRRLAVAMRAEVRIWMGACSRACSLCVCGTARARAAALAPARRAAPHQLVRWVCTRGAWRPRGCGAARGDEMRAVMLACVWKARR